MREKRIGYTVGSLLFGLAIGFLFANYTATGAGADTHRAETGGPVAIGNNSARSSDHSKAGHKLDISIQRFPEDLTPLWPTTNSNGVTHVEPATLDLLSPHNAGLPAGQEDKPVEQTQKNIQVLKGLPSSQLFIEMNFIRASLGVSCAYCHVYKGDDKWEWEKDDKPTKRTARKMIQMVFDINRTNFNGEKRVTCYTCHRGQTDPAQLPPLPQIQPEGGAAGGSKIEKPAATWPTVDQVLSKYVEALGGKAALEKLKTRTIKGSQIRFDGTALPVEIYQAAPNKLVSIITTANGTVSSGFNGTLGWTKSPRGQRDLSGWQLVQMKRSADFYGDLNLKALYPNMTLVGKEKITDRETYIIQSQVSDKRAEKLYFDTQTGLLIRVLGLDDTILGAIPDQADLSDYRVVDGVKLPFTIQMSYVDPWIGWTRKFTEIKHNVPVDDAKFNAPAK